MDTQNQDKEFNRWVNESNIRIIVRALTINSLESSIIDLLKVAFRAGYEKGSNYLETLKYNKESYTF